MWGRWWIGPSTPGSDEVLPAMARTAGLLLLLGLAGYLVRQLAEFRDPYAPWQEDLSILLGTTWGTAWKVGMGTALVSAIGLFFARPSAVVSWLVATLGLLVMATFPARTGHAAGVDPAWLAIPADTLHVIAASSWLGGLTFVFLADRRIRMAGGRSQLSHLVPAFHPLALGAVGILVLTGVFASLKHLSGLEALWTTPWSKLLALKLAITSIALILGGLNWRRWSPRLGDSGADEAMRSSGWFEMLLIHGVLLATAFLVRTSPS